MTGPTPHRLPRRAPAAVGRPQSSPCQTEIRVCCEVQEIRCRRAQLTRSMSVSRAVARATLGSSGPHGPRGEIAVARIVGEITIGAPVDEVFDMVADERNEPRYNPRIIRAEKLSEGPVAKGARFVAEPKGMGARGEMTVEVAEYDRPHRLHNVIRSSYMQVDGLLTFQEIDGATRLTWDWNMGLLGWMRLLSPVLAVIGPGWERRNWVALKSYMESDRR